MKGKISIARRQRLQRAFTLVEIMLVVLILSVFASAVAVNMRAGYQTTALDSNAEDLSDVMFAARNYSHLMQRECRLVIDTDQNEYYLSEVETPLHPSEPVKGYLGEGHTLSTGISFGDVQSLGPAGKGMDQIHFYPDGRADPCVVVLVSTAGDRKEIGLQRLGGYPVIR